MSFAAYYRIPQPVAKSLYDRLRSSHYHIAAEGQPAFRRAFATTVRSALSEGAAKEIERALEDGDVNGAVDVLAGADAWDGLEGKLAAAYEGVFEASAEQTLRALPSVQKAKKVAPKGLGQGVIARRAAELVADITREQRVTLALAITSGVDKGLTPAQISKRVRKVVGLLPREADAVENRRDLIERSLRRQYPKARRSFIEQRADKLQEKYAAELLVRRADRIAVTETSFAEARAKHEAWRFAKDKGLVKPTAKRRWVTSDAPCPECMKMAGKTAPIDGNYRGGVEGPPLHPHCFCLEEIV